MLDIFGLREADDPPPLVELDPALRENVRTVIVVLADGLGTGQLERLVARGAMPFLASLLDRAQRRDAAQLLDCTSVFPSTTAAAITTMNTARTPQEHGNLAYFLWLEEFAAVTQMLRWGRAGQRRGSFFDDERLDPRSYARVRSIHGRLRERGISSSVIEPDAFRHEAMERMHASEAQFVGYVIPSGIAVRLREALAPQTGPAYVYAYWQGIDYVAHRFGPESAEHEDEAAAFDLAIGRAFGGRPAGDVLVLLTADHGHAEVAHSSFIDLDDDPGLAALLRHPLAGEPRVPFFYTDHPQRVIAHLEREYPGIFFPMERDEAIAAGLFGRGDATAARSRVGEVVALLDGDRGASLVRVEGQSLRQRGSHGGMTPSEMRIPVLAWRC